MHVIEWDGILLTPEQGMLLGNGDLSVSVYQAADRIIWRLGKGDAWDRRLDQSKDPRPAHIDEMARGLEVEGWSCGPYGGPVEALHGTVQPERMREICQGVPPSNRLPFPMPKPLGELAFCLPGDFRRFKLRQALYIEEARLEIIGTWETGERLTVDSIVLPEDNMLAVKWRLENVDWQGSLIADRTEFTAAFSRWYFDLYRHSDTTYEEFADQHDIDPDFAVNCGCDAQETLPPPQVKEIGGALCLEQNFHPDKTFPDGFAYRLTPLAAEAEIREYKFLRRKTAQIRISPRDNAADGTIMVHVATTLSEGGMDENRQRALAGYASCDYAAAVRRNHAAARQFWANSGIKLGNSGMENTWYATLHIQRCIYGRGKVPPGLMIPSTIGDYVRWNGDYHSNYNFQSPFWGLAMANHPELLESYFKGAEFFHQIGRKIARDYYNCRGAFIQLTAYPLEAEDDYLGCCPMGRMAYMTGWLWHLHWEYYTHTLDLEFLRTRCWPLLRDCALFYTDFMKRGKDGCYHAFPSNCGEDGFNGDPSYYRDRKEVLQHAHYTLATAIKAALVLGDDTLVPEWQERLNHWPPISIHDQPRFRMEEHPLNPPEFNGDRWLDSNPESALPLFRRGHEFWRWYCGHLPMLMLTALHNRWFVPSRDFDNFCSLINRWREPNGTITAMSTIRYGRTGAWTEPLGILGAVQELLLQSWRGFIEVFPAWPSTVDAAFYSWRVAGAFLVSASMRNGTVEKVTIHSEKGGICLLRNPWPGRTVTVGSSDVKLCGDIIKLETSPERQYELSLDIR